MLNSPKQRNTPFFNKMIIGQSNKGVFKVVNTIT